MLKLLFKNVLRILRWRTWVVSRASIFEQLPNPKEGGGYFFFTEMSGKGAKTMSRSHFRVK